MKTTRKVQKTVEQEETVSLTCDFCGCDLHTKLVSTEEKEAEQHLSIEPFGSFYSDITVECRISNGYPEGGYGHTFSLDVCIPCFKQRIMDKAQTHTHKESDY